jgi:hypothetical protein
LHGDTVLENRRDSTSHLGFLPSVVALARAIAYSYSVPQALRPGRNSTAHPHITMAKTQNSKKETKKQPLLTPKEKKLAKQAKKKG